MEDDNSPARILVGVDGSGSSIDALRAAARIATAMDARIRAVMTWEYPAKFYSTPGGSPESDARDMLSDAVTQAFGSELVERMAGAVDELLPIPGSASKSTRCRTLASSGTAF